MGVFGNYQNGVNLQKILSNYILVTRFIYKVTL